MILPVMSCPCGGQMIDTSPIVDIEKIIQDYAWKELRQDVKWYQSAFYRRASFDIEVPWNYLELEHKTVRFTPRNQSKKTGKSVELFSTNFRNNTAREQSYKFMAQRQTKASTSVTFQRGFSIKSSTNFKLSVPMSDIGVSAGIDGQLHITKTSGETFDETFTWETNSDVIVEANHVTTAQMLLTEHKCIADFEVRTVLQMPSGEAPIIFKRKSDKEVHSVLLINDLVDVFVDTDRSVVTIIKDEDPRRRNHRIELITTGVMESCGWRDQRIELESHKITDEDDITTITSLGKDFYSKALLQAARDSFEREKSPAESDRGDETDLDEDRKPYEEQKLRDTSDTEAATSEPIKMKPTIAVRSYSQSSKDDRSAKVKRISFADTRDTHTFPRMTSV